mmetsp:Transcript_4078/g.4208  ORF Transcript_4078/g.4208 Transcript_4078/m.4208 type:complete len:524 (-) Transcript_4078:169-1740(-)
MILFVIIVSIICYVSDGLRNPLLPTDEFVPDYSEFYYYRNLYDKMEESLSVNNCSTSGDSTGFEPNDGRTADFDIRVIPPSKAVIKRWGTEGYEKHNISRLFIRTSPNLCEAKSFLEFKRGGILYAKGCVKMVTINKLDQRIKFINRYASTLHPDHIRCYAKKATSQCVTASTHPLQLPNEFRSLNTYPFLIKVKNAIVSRSGFLTLPCGPLGLFSSCEAVKYGIPSSTALINNVTECRKDETKCAFPVYDKVFVMTQYDDTQIGQFLQESLPKLVYHLDFILANPDMKIQYGFTKRMKLPSVVLPHQVFQWLGIADRLINGTVYAKQAYMPREGGCQDVGYNAWEFVTTRDVFLNRAKVDQDDYTSQRSIIIVTRSWASSYSANRGDHVMRGWPHKALRKMIKTLKSSCPNHKIEIFSDLDTKLMQCRDCQIKLFHSADITIAIHGAGLTNTMFMRPGGVVIEVVPKFDSRHSPMVGIFPRLSGIIGLHHYTYYQGKDMSTVDTPKLVDSTIEFAKAVGIHF